MKSRGARNHRRGSGLLSIVLILVTVAILAVVMMRMRQGQDARMAKTLANTGIGSKPTAANLPKAVDGYMERVNQERAKNLDCQVNGTCATPAATGGDAGSP